MSFADFDFKAMAIDQEIDIFIYSFPFSYLYEKHVKLNLCRNCTIPEDNV